MADKKYLYRGPLNVITVSAENGITLHGNRTYDLPEKHPQVVALVANGFLTEVAPEQPAAVPVKTKKEAADAS